MRSDQPPAGQSVLHYAFDLWMRRNGFHLPFERYADDSIVHGRTEREANLVRVKVAARLKQCGLELHPEKTKVVYGKDANRQETHPNEKFDFLGYTFRPRIANGRRGRSSVVSVQPCRRKRNRKSGTRSEDGS